MDRLRAYLQLCRFPAVFTAMADIVLGFLLVHTRLAPVGEFVLLLIASSCLYLAGMVFNDVFDRAQDAAERPQRPIPSGRIPLRTAVTLGGVLVICGIGAATLASAKSLLVALLLTACIFAYDGLLKSTPAGPIVMGCCRFLNVILGTSSASRRFVELWGLPQLWVAAALGVYIIGVTWFARTEARDSSRRSLLVGVIVANVGLVALVALANLSVAQFAGWNGGGDAVMCAVALGVIALTIDRRASAALLDPSPANVQVAVKIMLLSLVTIDATMIYFKLGPPGTTYAVATLLLLVPAVLVGRWIAVT
jgi:4-hydroxybenzoate polyprenyltransferase